MRTCRRTPFAFGVLAVVLVALVTLGTLGSFLVGGAEGHRPSRVAGTTVRYDYDDRALFASDRLADLNPGDGQPLMCSFGKAEAAHDVLACSSGAGFAPQGARRFGPGAAHIDDPALGGAGKWMSPDEFADDVIRETRNQYRSLPTETGQHGAGLRAAARDLREQARTAGYLPEIRDRLLRKAEEWEARARGIDHPGRR